MSRFLSHYRQYQCNPRVNTLVDCLYGKESQSDAVGALARFVRANVRTRPALDGTSQWLDIAAMKVHAAQAGPFSVTPSDFDAALDATGLK